MATKKVCCSDCVWQGPINKGWNAGCLKEGDCHHNGPVECNLYLDINKIRRRYAENRNRLDFLLAIVSDASTPPRNAARIRKEMEKLADKVAYDKWTLDAVPNQINALLQSMQKAKGQVTKP